MSLWICCLHMLNNVHLPPHKTSEICYIGYYWKYSYGAVKQICSHTKGINCYNLFREWNLNMCQKFLYEFLRSHAKDTHEIQGYYHQYYIYNNKNNNNFPKIIVQGNDLYINLSCINMMWYYIITKFIFEEYLMTVENIHIVKRKEQDVNQIVIVWKEKTGCKILGQFFKKLNGCKNTTLLYFYNLDL